MPQTKHMPMLVARVAAITDRGVQLHHALLAGLIRGVRYAPEGVRIDYALRECRLKNAIILVCVFWSVGL